MRRRGARPRGLPLAARAPRAARAGRHPTRPSSPHAPSVSPRRRSSPRFTSSLTHGPDAHASDPRPHEPPARALRGKNLSAVLPALAQPSRDLEPPANPEGASTRHHKIHDGDALSAAEICSIRIVARKTTPRADAHPIPLVSIYRNLHLLAAAHRVAAPISTILATANRNLYGDGTRVLHHKPIIIVIECFRAMLLRNSSSRLEHDAGHRCRHQKYGPHQKFTTHGNAPRSL